MSVMSDSVLEPVCETCGKPVDPDAPGVVKAVAVTRVDAMGTAEWIEDRGVFFHDDCYPYGSGDFRIVEP
jgi:hypothetical protein